MFKPFNIYENKGVTSADLSKLHAIALFKNGCSATENALHAIASRLKTNQKTRDDVSFLRKIFYDWHN